MAGQCNDGQRGATPLDATTIVRRESSSEDESPSLVTTLVVAWSADEPWRVAELAVVPEEGPELTLGRGEGRGNAPRLRLFRQRPGKFEPTGPLASPSLSREHVALRPRGERVEIERMGQAAIHVDGRPCDVTTIEHGSVVRLGREMVLACVRRPALIPSLRFFPRDAIPAFGKPDATGALGETPSAWQLREAIAFAAKSGTHVLLVGESGSGKELAARGIHRFSARADRIFVARNAATLPEGLIDAELFGNVRNYPNPGMPERPGLMGEANGGTLFLDEIGELPSELQAHLLRVLDAGGEYQRLGESMTRRSDFVLVGATNRGLAGLKSDLAARLMSRIEVPPLASRLEDIPLLVDHLVQRAARRAPELAAKFVQRIPQGADVARMAPELVEHLLMRRYTTHTREIEALVWRAVEQSPGDALTLSADDMRLEPARPPRRRPDEEPTAEAIRDALRAEGGDRARAATALGLSSRFALYRLMKKHGIVQDADEG